MDTFGLFGDTQSPFSFLGYLMPKLFVLRDGDDGGGGTLTHTQTQVDEAVNAAVKTANEGRPSGLDGLGEGVKDHPSITRYKSVEELAKGHLELEKTIGLKGTLIPTENSSDEVKNKYFKDIGRPDLADGYGNPVVDGLHEGVKNIADVDIKAYKEKAFELGFSAKQAQGMIEWHLGVASQRLTDYDKTLQDESNAASTVLRAKWAGTYDERLALSNGLITKFGGEKADALMTKFGSDPDSIEFLHSIGSQLSEDKLGELGRTAMGMSPEMAKLEIPKIEKQIMDTETSDPNYKVLIDRNTMLHKIAFNKT